MASFQDKVSFIWSVIDLLRGDYQASEYGRVVPPLAALQPLDCVLEPTKAVVPERGGAAVNAGRVGRREPVSACT